jgi:hypothetical protein
MQYVFSASADKWEIDDNGFMRCPARFLSVGIMPYAAGELDDIAPDAEPDTILSILVPPDTLADPRAIRSLEGMPVLAYDHTWTGPDKSYKQVGSVAGTPRVDGPYLCGSVVITDQDTMAAIKAGTLCEISSAYYAMYTMESGDYDGQTYDGRQSQLRYNHIALLPPGEGRAGRDVRITNRQKTGVTTMSEFTLVQLPTGHKVRVFNADVDVVNQAVDTMEKKATSNQAASGAQLESLMAELEQVKQEKAAIDAKFSELEGQLQAVKEELEAALTPENVEEAAETMMNERDEAADTLVNNEIDDKQTAMNSLKGLTGHKLRVKVVNSVRVKRGLAALTDEQAKNEGFVQGMYESYRGAPKAGPVSAADKRHVSGAESMRSRAANKGAGKDRSAMSRLGYPKQVAK